MATPRNFCSYAPPRRADALRSALAAFADASAIGTTVLQIKEIPARPSEFDGKICLFDLAEGVGKPEICERLRAFGDIVSYEEGAGYTPAILRFKTHEAALTAKHAASELKSLCGGVDALYNERSYDGRKGEEGLDDDNGRGWCAPSYRTALPRPLISRPPAERAI